MVVFDLTGIVKNHCGTIFSVVFRLVNTIVHQRFPREQVYIKSAGRTASGYAFLAASRYMSVLSPMRCFRLALALSIVDARFPGLNGPNSVFV